MIKHAVRGRCAIVLLVAGVLHGCGCDDDRSGEGDSAMSDVGSPRCEAGQTDFYGTCLETFRVFAQPDFRSATRDTVTANQIYHAAGIAIDRSVRPHRVYVVDSGNQRVLGFAGIGHCSMNEALPCNVDADCTEDTCTVTGLENADKVFGQSTFDQGACNRDANVGTNGRAGADTLCLIPFPRTDNVAESLGKVNIDVDSEGNLYVPDVSNNRVLRYDQPFNDRATEGRGDTIADFVWGQPDFDSNGINHGLGREERDAESLFIGQPNDIPMIGNNHTVSIDAEGALWVADTYNNRVLRFPSGEQEADLVIGQSDFESAVCDMTMNKLCTPTIAKVHPDTGELFVVEEHGTAGAFSMRIVVYAPPFENGMAPARMFTPATAGFPIQATGLTYNTYRQGAYATGEWWLTEHSSRRVVLIDGAGAVVQVLNALSAATPGFDYADYGACGLDMFAQFNLYQPSGAVGLDADGNIYIPDEHSHRIARFALPYTLVNNGVRLCPPATNGGLMGGERGPNAISAAKIGESRGLAIYQSQLIVRDEKRYLAWNDYQQPVSRNANVIVGQAAPDVRAETDSQLGSGGLHAIDDRARLWTANTNGALSAYQLPLTNGAAALGYTVELAWADDMMPVTYRAAGIAFEPTSRRLYVADAMNHRILRIQSIDVPLNMFRVDAVIGQPDKATVLCNNNQPAGTVPGPPTERNMCEPSMIRFDNNGNLFVVENNYGCHGNDRITMFTSEDLASITTLFPNIIARNVFVRSSLTEQANCALDAENQPTSPIAIAFNSHNHMVVANDGTFRGPGADTDVRHVRQLWLYMDPLLKDAEQIYIQGQLPDAYIPLPIGAVGEMWFDEEDNLVIQDRTWSRVLMINLERDPSWVVPLR